MKIERKATFEEWELDALRKSARIKCTGVPCGDRPMNDHKGGSGNCIVVRIREMLESQNIDF